MDGANVECIQNTRPRSARTNDPDELSNKPLRHSNVSADAKLISSSRTQCPAFNAVTNIPYTTQLQDDRMLPQLR